MAIDLIHQIFIAATAQKKKDKEAKVTTARTLWIPAVNGHGEFGCREFLEIEDPWDAAHSVRKFVKSPKP